MKSTPIKPIWSILDCSAQRIYVSILLNKPCRLWHKCFFLGRTFQICLFLSIQLDPIYPLKGGAMTMAQLTLGPLKKPALDTAFRWCRLFVLVFFFSSQKISYLLPDLANVCTIYTEGKKLSHFEHQECNQFTGKIIAVRYIHSQLYPCYAVTPKLEQHTQLT